MSSQQSSTAIARAEKPKVPVAIGNQGVELRSIEEAWRFATIVSASGLAPKGMQEAEKIFVAIQHGLEVGLKPYQAIQSIAVVNGRPTMWGDAVIALVLSSGLLEWQKDWEEGTGTNLVVTYSCKRVGQPEPVTRSFSWADAVKAGLAGKDTYKNYPRRMCFNRARAFGLRDLFPDILRGINIREEVEEFSGRASASRPAITRREVELSDLAAAEPEEPLPAGAVSSDSDVIDVEAESVDDVSQDEEYDPAIDAGQGPEYEDESQEPPEDDGNQDGPSIYQILWEEAEGESVAAPSVRRRIDEARRGGGITDGEAMELEVKLQQRVDNVKARGNPKPTTHGADATARGRAKKKAMFDEPPDGSDAYRQ